MKKIELRFFEDAANGEWGLAHKNSIDRGFNAFYDGAGIFHDVFEHSHEETKYFMGDAAFNVGGEMAAMGAMWYIYSELGVYNREINRQSIYPFSDQMRMTTEMFVQEAICDGYTTFGDTLVSNVPYQRPVENGELEYQIRTFWENVKTWHPDGYDECRDYGRDYKKSVTFGKIANLHRYGYRMAERWIPNNYHNQETLSQFIKYWSNFCKYNDAEELGSMYRGIDFRIYKKQGNIDWIATLLPYYPYKSVKLNQDKSYFLT